ncbi:MAG: IS481 family transposase [Clostridiales bacterium]|nr:IS481 family transposase [Clostridiales bacterium]MCF8022652.1 IS481 family transposase [Clostridiales bacterium]
MYTHPTALRARRQAMKLDNETNNLNRREIAEKCHMSHTTFYKIRKRYEEHGDAGLYDKENRPRIKHNQTPPDIEEIILAYVQDNPAHGPRRISGELKKEENGGIKIGETAVYGVLKRNNINTQRKRLQWIDSLQPPKEKTAWELDKEASKRRHVHAPVPGYLMSQDGKCIGRLAGIGRVYAQVGIDCASSFGWARLYTDKTSNSTADFLRHACSSYKSMGAYLQRVLTDNGKEYGSSEPTIGHNYGAACYFLNIKHKTTKTKHPWTNGYAERFVQTLYQEFFQIALRRKKYTSLKELQEDLNNYLYNYNWKRPHQGRRTRGRTPAQAFFVPYQDQHLLPEPGLVV